MAAIHVKWNFGTSWNFDHLRHLTMSTIKKQGACSLSYQRLWRIRFRFSYPIEKPVSPMICFKRDCILYALEIGEEVQRRMCPILQICKRGSFFSYSCKSAFNSKNMQFPSYFSSLLPSFFSKKSASCKNVHKLASLMLACW